MYIIDRNTRPDSEYSEIHINVNDKNSGEFNYNDIEQVTVSDFGLMEILFNDGGSVIRNIHRNITYYITLTKNKTQMNKS